MKRRWIVPKNCRSFFFFVRSIAATAVLIGVVRSLDFLPETNLMKYGEHVKSISVQRIILYRM